MKKEDKWSQLTEKYIGKEEIMSKRVYISADYAPDDGDQDVVNVLHQWGKDDKHKTNFVDTAQVSSGSVSEDADCRPCDLKTEFNSQINASSAVIIVVGDKTSSRTAGSGCERSFKKQSECNCTPYKQNTKGAKDCMVEKTYNVSSTGDVGSINSYSYLQHEFEQAKKKNKTIIVVYNSLYRQPGWLPGYLSDYEDDAHPFWTKNVFGNKIGDYQYIKKALGYE